MNKDLLTNSPQRFEENDLAVISEMILKESLLKYRIEKLRKRIDRTLVERDREEFIKLTDELNSILAKEYE